ncbi:anti-sigma regulatory factor (Ser/Thr protein kinase) [Streptomyces sp. PvR006]|uniref:ATP-binding protein n=1 Tax=Streptomyces sp. PvR006 TaxID=2817860 RepID=UPI001AE8EF5E|nr:ATP-binding protein [Streptomyces sp. PvR006]MBP2582638.1 anti-sigma regulatory factor (Ser/Thr protein kinase) [Streptomyces sp. PvR006]
MTSNNLSPTGTTELSLCSPYLGSKVFALRFTSTARGARLARRLVAVRLDEWGVAYGTGAHETVVLVAAELATNAVRHGHVPGRDFHLSLRVADGLARVEVSDTRAERVPPRPGELVGPRPELSDGGRGLLLVDALADRWGWCPRRGAPGKTVWAECALT